MKTGVAGIVLGVISCVIAVATAIGLRDVSNALDSIEERLGAPATGSTAKGGSGTDSGGRSAADKAAAAEIVALKTELGKVTTQLNDLRIALGSVTTTGGGTADPAALRIAVEAVLAKVAKERQEADAKRWAEKQMGNANRMIAGFEKNMELTTEQKESVTKILQAQFQKVAELIAGSDEPGTAIYTSTGIREETEQQMRALLTQTQQEKWDKMDKSWLPGATPHGSPPGKGLVGPGGSRER